MAGKKRSTLRERIAAMEPGARVRLEPGEYLENLVLDKPISIRGPGLSSVIVGIPGSGPVIDIRSAGVSLRDFAVEHLDPDGVAVVALRGTSPSVSNVRNYNGQVWGVYEVASVRLQPLPSDDESPQPPPLEPRQPLLLEPRQPPPLEPRQPPPLEPRQPPPLEAQQPPRVHEPRGDDGGGTDVPPPHEPGSAPSSRPGMEEEGDRGEETPPPKAALPVASSEANGTERLETAAPTRLMDPQSAPTWHPAQGFAGKRRAIEPLFLPDAAPATVLLAGNEGRSGLEETEATRRNLPDTISLSLDTTQNRGSAGTAPSPGSQDVPSPGSQDMPYPGSQDVPSPGIQDAPSPGSLNVLSPGSLGVPSRTPILRSSRRRSDPVESPSSDRAAMTSSETLVKADDAPRRWLETEAERENREKRALELHSRQQRLARFFWSWIAENAAGKKVADEESWQVFSDSQAEDDRPFLETARGRLADEGYVQPLRFGVPFQVAWRQRDEMVAFYRIGWKMFRSGASAAFYSIPLPAVCGAVSADGRFVAIASENIVLLFEGPRLRWQRKVDHTVRDLVFSPASSWLAVAGSGLAVPLLELDQGDEAGRIYAPRQDVLAVAVSPDGASIALGCRSGEVAVSCVDRPKERLRVNVAPDAPETLAFSPDGGLLVARAGNRLLVWLATNGRPVAGIPCGEGSSGCPGDGCVRGVLDFSPDGRWLVSPRQDNVLGVWETAGWNLARVLSMPGVFRALAFSPDGRWLASASSVSGICTRDFSSGEIVRTLEAHTGVVETMAFSPDGRLLAIGDSSGAIELWDVVAGTRKWSEKGGQAVQALEFSPDGSLIVCGGEGRALQAWPVARSRNEPLLYERREPIRFLSFSPRGSALAVATSSGMLRLFDVRDTLRVRRVPGQLGLAMAGGLIRGPLRDSLPGAGSRASSLFTGMSQGEGAQLAGTFVADKLSYSPDGKILAIVDERGRVRLWDAGTGASIVTLSGHRDGTVFALFLEERGAIFTGGQDGKIRVWRLPDGAPCQEVPHRFEHLTSLCLSGDRRTLVATGESSVLRLWRLSQTPGGVDILPSGQSIDPQLGPGLRVVVSPTAPLLAIATGDGAVALYYCPSLA